MQIYPNCLLFLSEMYTCFGSINLKFDSVLESIRLIRLLFILGYFNLTEENKYEDNLTNRG